MAAVLSTFKELKKTKFKDIYVSENDLNGLGYELIKKFPNEAVELFKLNVKMYPKSYNVYDSLAEGYMTAGNNKLAIKNYQKSLKLNPKNTNATDMIKKMETPAAKQ
jgi:Tfp pilus assembly protein PilF